MPGDSSEVGTSSEKPAGAARSPSTSQKMLSWSPLGSRARTQKRAADPSSVRTAWTRFNFRRAHDRDDAFHGAFIYGLMLGWPVPRCAEFANAVAARVAAAHPDKLLLFLIYGPPLRPCYPY